MIMNLAIHTKASPEHIDTDSVRITSDPDKVTITSDPDKLTITSDPDSVTITSDPDNVTITSDPDSVTITSDPDNVTIISDPDNVTITSDPNTNNPDRVWRKIKEKQLFQTIKPLDLNTPIYEDKIRFVCLSDTHSKLTPDFVIPPGDILLHSGDFTNEGQAVEIEWFNTVLSQLRHKQKIFIAGNHELSFDPRIFVHGRFFHINVSAFKRYLALKGVASAKELVTNAIYLQDSMVTICGINIYGSPWQPMYCDWAFNLERGNDILEKWNWIPNNVDVLMTHGPPLGHGDIIKAGPHVGCVELLNTVQQRVKPKYHVFGHVHEGYGITSDGVTTFINASSCTKGYHLRNQPIIFDVPLPPGQSKDSLDDAPDIVSFAKEETTSKKTSNSISKHARQAKASLLSELTKKKKKTL